MKRFFFLIVMTALMISGCGGSSGSGSSSSDYSGEYSVLISGDNMTIDIRQNGTAISFRLTGENTDVSGTGTLTDPNASMQGELEGGILAVDITFADDGKSFSGTWSLSIEGGSSGTVSGTKGGSDVVTYDIDANGIPQFVATQYIELDRIRSISMFRSGEGHDYSDDFESCRSMKHYFRPPNGADWSTIKVYSPVDGTVIDVTQEWAGIKLTIQSTEHPAITFALFHVNVTPALVFGDTVSAGQQIGTHISNQTSSDIAVRIATPTGNRLVSYFDVMTDALFAIYQARGIQSRGEAIITMAQRDADPLACSGETFANGGSLANTVVLN